MTGDPFKYEICLLVEYDFSFDQLPHNFMNIKKKFLYTIFNPVQTGKNI